MTGRFLSISILATIACFVGGLMIGKSSGGAEGTGSAALKPTENKTDGVRLSALSKGGTQRISREISDVARSKDYGLYQKMGAYFKLISEAESSEMPGLIEAIQREVHGEMGTDLFVAAIAKRWATIDAPGAFDALLSGKIAGLEWGEENIISAIATADPRGAWEQILAAEAGGTGAMQNSQKQNQLFSSLIGKISEEDPALMTELLTELDDPNLYRFGLGKVYASLASKEPIKFLEQREDLPITHSRAKRDLGSSCLFKPR